MTTLPPILEQRVFGMPLPQPRVKTRLFRNQKSPLGVSTSHYEPATAKDWKRTIVAQCLGQKPPAPVEGPLFLTVRFYLPRPASLPKRVTHPVRRPDLKNLIAAVEDALNGIFYRDDSQIVGMDPWKAYDAAPGVWIRLDHVVEAAASTPQQFNLTTAPA